jgi:hypothetical protein
MELFIPHTPLAFVVITVLAFAATVKIVKDIKDVRASRRTHGLIMRYMTKKNVPKISIVVELRHVASTIFPLIDHLYQHNYPGLEVIVVVKQTAGKYAHAKLSYYRRKHQRKSLRIVKHSKGMDTSVVVRRFASSPFVMKLKPTDRLSEKFFNDLSLELLNNEVSIFVPRTHVIVGKTLVSALYAVNAMWKHTMSGLRSTVSMQDKTVEDGKIYRRRDLLKGSELQSMYVSRVAVHRASVESWRVLLAQSSSRSLRLMQSKKVRAFAIAGIAVSVGLGAYLWNQDVLLLAELILAIYLIAYTRLLLGLKGYSMLERLSLLLFAPFSVALIVIVTIHSSATIAYRQLKTVRLL